MCVEAPSSKSTKLHGSETQWSVWIARTQRLAYISIKHSLHVQVHAIYTSNQSCSDFVVIVQEKTMSRMWPLTELRGDNSMLGDGEIRRSRSAVLCSPHLLKKPCFSSDKMFYQKKNVLSTVDLKGQNDIIYIAFSKWFTRYFHKPNLLLSVQRAIWVG